MAAILLAGGILIGVVMVGVRCLTWLACRTPDLDWRPTGVRCTTGRDYLQAQAIANAREARHYTARGRRYHRGASLPAVRGVPVTLALGQPAVVVPLRRHA